MEEWKTSLRVTIYVPSWWRPLQSATLFWDEDVSPGAAAVMLDDVDEPADWARIALTLRAFVGPSEALVDEELSKGNQFDESSSPSG